ncbi:hypothetical protein BX616_006076 [Lobosporangium transversale]|uniref:Uncharacterized protein n=1 Tax=Lobosporangium transversale TaxID=64571 RepID=A0A1Y2H1E9_9FUNG|nr:hypothetical protein BCR41DRAFT_383208 [Lobosporangium transversale]KAF9897164.1 hypothetical protein BX616_006076 [Lobosporangium transversale]ORZ28378.1 hypothetical protein BCR41DRAFT_383208 [Lobosporangium transversale]|eukprot:XP_021886063.1 hypothetical protein BCR41DRAFT_383208 [Lobosporangium transversale]
MTHTTYYGDKFPKGAHVILFESEEFPTTVGNLTWSLKAAWHDLDFPSRQSQSPKFCHVDPSTGVFTQMTSYNVTFPNTDGTITKRPPGGFQYDPRSNKWSEFAVSSDYRWSDYSPTFTLFSWPGTSTLFQANIGENNTVNLGKLTINDQGQNQFMNVMSWELDPTVYGLPTRLVYGNNTLYQFGTQVVNSKTGELKNLMTKIPISGDSAKFTLPANLTVYHAQALDRCGPFKAGIYYRYVVYVFCQAPEGHGLIWMYDARPNAINDLNAAYPSDGPRFAGAMIHPFGGFDEDGVGRNALLTGIWWDGDPTVEISLDPAYIGHMDSVPWHINITEPYGMPFDSMPQNETDSSNNSDSDSDGGTNTGAIIGGSIVGALLILVFLIFRRRWPHLRKRLRSKIAKSMSAESKNSDTDKSKGHGVAGITVETDKIEASSIQSYDLDGRDKIPVEEEDLGQYRSQDASRNMTRSLS